MFYSMTVSVDHITGLELRRVASLRLVNNELERVWKEAVVAQFKVLSQHLTGGIEKTTNTPVGIADVRTEI
jgi:hypothetical protein